MKNIHIYIVAVMATLFTACSMGPDQSPIHERFTSFGVIAPTTHVSDVLFSILNDSGETLDVVRYDTPSYRVTVGERVLFKYEVVGENEAWNRTVRVRGFNSLLVQPIIVRSQSHNTHFGKDPIHCNASFGGEYINLNYEYLCEGDSEHIISLVWDDTMRNTGYAELFLCHNAHGETLTEDSESVYGIASFRISQLIPEGETQLAVRLHWRWYDDEGKLADYSATGGTFVPFQTTKF